MNKCSLFIIYFILIRSSFEHLFDNFDCESVREEILSRRVVECNFTTVLWRLFLCCLPHDSSQWNEILDVSRANYAKFEHQYQIDPHEMNDNKDDSPIFNHPLSRDENVTK